MANQQPRAPPEMFKYLHRDAMWSLCKGLRGCDFLHNWSIASQLSSAVWTRHSPADFPICSRSSSPNMWNRTPTFSTLPKQSYLHFQLSLQQYTKHSRNSNFNRSNWLHKFRRSTSIKFAVSLRFKKTGEETRTEGGWKAKSKGVFPLQQRKHWSREK